MTFKVYYVIKKNLLVYVGLDKLEGAKKVQFDSYETAVIFEDRLIRLQASKSYTTEKMIREIVKGVNKQ